MKITSVWDSIEWTKFRSSCKAGLGSDLFNMIIDIYCNKIWKQFTCKPWYIIWIEKKLHVLFYTKFKDQLKKVSANKKYMICCLCVCKFKHIQCKMHEPPFMIICTDDSFISRTKIYTTSHLISLPNFNERRVKFNGGLKIIAT